VCVPEASKRSRRAFDPHSSDPYLLSRSKLELFLHCPRCFVLDCRHGIGRLDDAYYSLNLTVDLLLKREFDAYRLRQQPHPLMKTYGVHAVPLQHPQLREWRDTPTGIRVHHKPTDFLFYGIVDDVWTEDDGTLIVVDYKATSTSGDVHVADIPRLGYERQLAVYQWLLRRSGFAVSSTGYLVYANALRERPSFEKKLDFSLHLVPVPCDGSWIEDALQEAKSVLVQETLPAAAAQCEWCAYRSAVKPYES
jgi:hypothetical protein